MPTDTYYGWCAGTGGGNKKLIDWVEWQDLNTRLTITDSDGTVHTMCEQCREKWAKQGKEPPCDTCYTPLLPENIEATEIYFIVRNQFITAGMGKPIDINIVAVKAVMDINGVQDQKSCLQKVRAVSSHFITKMHEEQEG